MFTNKLLCLSLVRLIPKPKLNLRLTFLLHKQNFFFFNPAQIVHKQLGSFIPLCKPLTRMWIPKWA